MSENGDEDVEHRDAADGGGEADRQQARRAGTYHRPVKLENRWVLGGRSPDQRFTDTRGNSGP